MYVAGKRLKIDGKWREPGEPVPEAVGWRRSTVNGLVGARRLIEVHSEDDVAVHPVTPSQPEPRPDETGPQVTMSESHPGPRVAKLESVSDITVGEAIKFALDAPLEVVQEMLDEERAGKRRTTLIASLTHILEDAGV